MDAIIFMKGVLQVVGSASDGGWIVGGDGYRLGPIGWVLVPMYRCCTTINGRGEAALAIAVLVGTMR
jgi:hypothetical protein